MNVRSALIVMLTAPATSIALAQMYPPAPKSNPAVTPPPTSTVAPAPAAPAAQAAAGPTAQTAGAPAMPSVPPPGCVQPVYPGKNASNEKIKTFNTTNKDYGDCIRKYVDAVRTLANTAIQSGNDAVSEYNTFTTDTQKLLEADK